MTDVKRSLKMKSWRPENWGNPYDEHSSYVDEFTEDALHDIYEAGADALLGGLKAEGVHMKNDNPVNMTIVQVYGFFRKCSNGWLVFFPDNDEE